MKRRRASFKGNLNMYWKTQSCSCPTVLMRDPLCIKNSLKLLKETMFNEEERAVRYQRGQVHTQVFILI